MFMQNNTPNHTLSNPTRGSAQEDGHGQHQDPDPVQETARNTQIKFISTTVPQGPSRVP